MRKIIALCLATGLSAAVPAQAQELPFGEPADLVSELVVRARTPGPAWWKVADADTTVWVLGSPGRLPQNVLWDEGPLKRRLTGASQLILPTREDGRILPAMGFLLSFKKQVSDPRPVAERIPKDLLERLAAVTARERAAAPPQKSSGGLSIGVNSPRAATLAMGVLLTAEKPLGKLVNEPSGRAQALARPLKVKVVYGGSYDTLQAVRFTLAMPDAAQNACLAGALDLLEAKDQYVAAERARAAAWASGDVPRAVGAHYHFDIGPACQPPPGVKAMQAAGRSATVSAVQTALAKPGHAVAIIDLGDLLQTGGVLDQLRAKGMTVTAPDVLSD